MSLASTAAKSAFGDVMPAHQIAASSTLVAENFTGFQQEKQAANTFVIPTGNTAPTPERLSELLYGRNCHDKVKAVRPDELAVYTQNRTAEFADQLHQHLAKASIDLNIPLELTVGPSGEIVVDGNHPNATEIAEMFEEMPAFVQAYRDIAAQNDQLAMQQVGAAYIKEWNTAKDDNERQASWNRYSILLNKLSSLFSGRMIIGPGTVVTESQQILRRMGIA